MLFIFNMVLRTIRSKARKISVTPITIFLILIVNAIFILSISFSSVSWSNNIGNITKPEESSNNKSFEVPEILRDYTESFPEVPPIQEKLIKFYSKPQNICDNHPEILLIVHSNVKNFKHREILRKTIGKHKSYNGFETKIVFVTGEDLSVNTSHKLKTESEQHNDILSIAMIDKYTRLSYKAVGWMKWLTSSSCSSIKHIIKLDDDAFINMFKLTKFYKTCKNTEKRDPICDKMSCMLWHHFRPHRKGKYLLTESEYSRKEFPPFCPGIMVLIPGPLVPKLFEATAKVPFLRLDDVYLTGLLMEQIGETHYNFGDKMVNTLLKNYGKIDQGKMLVGHFKDDVENGVYEKHWKKVEAKFS